MNRILAKAHRAAFLERLDEGDVVVLRTGPERVRSNDTTYRFRPDSDFWYLTAFPEPDAVAVFAPHHDPGPYLLFVPPRDPEKETWHGRRAGTEGAVERYGADASYPLTELDERLPRLLEGARSLHYRTGEDADFDRKLLDWTRGLARRTRNGTTGPGTLVDPSLVLHEMRLRKSADELEVMRRAAVITEMAHRAAMASVRPGRGEWELEALVDGTFRSQGGWGPGYTTICASGDNANILHYTTNDAVVQEGDLLLLDAGCEVLGYTADVTRTFPASGSFSPAQRELYDVVLNAQLAAIAAAQPGRRFDDVHQAALIVLVQGLLDLELLSGSLDENLEGQTYRRWYMHRTSHWLGLDVHDVGRYHDDGEQSRVLEPGMVLTVEPGLYVPAGDEQAPERFRGTGIRIEDDVAITAEGHDVLTASIPKTIDDLEAAL